MYSTIVIDWTGRMPSGEEALVMQRAANMFPADDEKAAVEFTHSLCEGLMTCKGRKTIGTISGVIFHAYLGEHKGTPWTYEFLLVDGLGQLDPTPDMGPVWITGAGTDQLSVTPVDVGRTTKVKTTKLKRQ